MTPTPLFATDTLRVVPMQAHEVPELQALFDANPLYFRTVNGRDAKPDEAQVEFDERPPEPMVWREHHVALVRDRAHAVVGVWVCTEGLIDPAVCHLGLMLLATPLHGQGLAEPLHAAFEAWAASRGTRWLRLGVVAGNARAERFWQRLGYRELVRRHGIDTGGRINDIRMMLKPLGDATREAYLERVPRDRADPPPA